MFLFDFVYTLSSANIDRSAPNWTKNLCPTEFEWVRSWTDHGPEQLELFALELGKKIPAFDLLFSMYKYKLISTKLGLSVYEHKISDEFDYGSSHTRSVSVTCL